MIVSASESPDHRHTAATDYYQEMRTTIMPLVTQPATSHHHCPGNHLAFPVLSPEFDFISEVKNPAIISE
ncbi:hypothetical protein [Desulfopila aestuarii]|uniref:Uncharacterized protein n=1 Tax=Desulfopila aestuarii DSM 18488 TaxID=1121416 RepID=A0A1M7XVL6_9BACT|nr:hypothetical protein [Desulfopila aestuarii]SHO42662.1 hypothetical protein SAMN02745220_00079 [Desulfopila aestuarii DSM 18488]